MVTPDDTSDVRTPGGRVLSEQDFEALADEAERGYVYEPGKRYRDTTTGRHVLFLYGAGAEVGFGAEWGYIVTAQPDGLTSDEIGAVHWTPHVPGRYLELSFDVGVIVAELRNVMGALFDEVDPSDETGEWDADRLPALGLAAATLFEAVDSHLQDGGSLPIEWNPYVVAQPCHAPHTPCEAHSDGKHCRCMRRRCDGHHGCACGHTWETEQG
jgi:hypothetical protein